MPAGAQLSQEAFEHTIKHRLIRIDSNQLIHCANVGQGPPVLLLHGFLKTWRSWRKVMFGMAMAHTLIVLDLPGLGQSSRPAPGYDGLSVAKTLHAMVKQLGYGQIDIVGHDVGGWMAYTYAAAYRPEVGRLIIVDVALPGIGLEKFMDLSKKEGAWRLGFNQVHDLPEQLLKGRERDYITWFAHHDTWVKDTLTEADISTYTQSYAEPGAIHDCLEYYRALPEDAHQNQASAGQKLTIPVLTVGAGHGLSDATHQDMIRVAKNVKAVQVPDSGHYIPEEQPESLTKLLTAFLAEK